MPADWDIFLGDSVVILVVAVAALVLLAYCLFRCCSTSGREPGATEKLVEDEEDDGDNDGDGDDADAEDGSDPDYIAVAAGVVQRKQRWQHGTLRQSRHQRMRQRAENFAYDCEGFLPDHVEINNEVEADEEADEEKAEADDSGLLDDEDDEDDDSDFSGLVAETNLDDDLVWSQLPAAAVGGKAATIVRLCQPSADVPDPSRAEFL